MKWRLAVHVEKTRRVEVRVVISVLFFLICSPAFAAQERINLSAGQTVYVPVYSNVISGPKKVPADLANTLIIRNTDLHNQIRVTVADYYDTKGGLIKSYYSQPETIGPLGTSYIYLSNYEDEGGVGANFIIQWDAAKEVNVPIIECVMVGSQGRAFVSSSQVIKKDTE
jgi:hypothetical protein